MAKNEEMDAAREVARMVKAEGGRALLVGGCVRDALMGGEPKDIDVECFGIAPDRLRAILSERFALDLVGASFGVLKLSHLDVDVAIPRRETKLGLGHRAFEMEYDPTLTVRDASARRDFTVNAIYRDPLTDEIVDPWNGRADLERKILRHVSDHFREDPLRVLRGMQFVARFGLSAAPETIEVCRAMTPEGLASDRRRSGIRKATSGTTRSAASTRLPRGGLATMRKTSSSDSPSCATTSGSPRARRTIRSRSASARSDTTSAAWSPRSRFCAGSRTRRGSSRRYRRSCGSTCVRLRCGRTIRPTGRFAASRRRS